MSRVWSLLRSRRLAVWLLVFVMVWSFAATVIPQTANEPLKTKAWADRYPWVEAVVRPLGLHDAYRTPVFLGVMALLFLSTTACAWERTRFAWRRFRTSRGLTAGEVRRLETAAAIRVALRDGVASDEALGLTRAALARLRLKTRGGTRVVEAAGGRWGLLGSPVFHIALAALFLVIGLGQLTRGEGLIGVPVGYPVDVTRAEFGRFDGGILYDGPQQGLSLAAERFELSWIADGVDRGASAVVELARDGVILARQRVYPNNPLRFGTVLIHQNEFGLSAVLRVEEASGTVLTSTTVLSDFDPGTASGMTPATFRIDGAGQGASSLGVEVAIQADHDGPAVLRRLPKTKRATVTVTGPAGYRESATLAAGDALVLPDGRLLRLVDIVYYARLSFVDDWSVYPIYALFVIAGIGVSVAVFTPYRVVRALLVERDGRMWLHADARHARRDPLFVERVEAALRDALGDPEGEAVG